MEAKSILVRLSEEAHAGLDVMKGKTRMSKSVQIEMALRDFFAKHGIQLEQPNADG